MVCVHMKRFRHVVPFYGSLPTKAPPLHSPPLLCPTGMA